ncbi:MAG: dTDP-glucose 4,6-dehydratase, partial [Oscillospiraceae bacterium]|nr:dTDP-glucose 4,6-dehydratase [Oscillospiraceae bacterium]
VSVREWVELCYRAAGRKAELRSVDKPVPQREYFPFYDYEYVLDVSKQTELMSETVPLERGLFGEFEWYKLHPESVYRRRPYMSLSTKT